MMRRSLPVLLISALVLGSSACKPNTEGAAEVVVIGAKPAMHDPALGPLSPPDAVLLTNVAQGLVRFDAAGNIVGGLAERWNVSDDGLSYIFRLSSAEWPDGRKITAEQVAKLLKRNLAPRSKNSLKDALGAVEDIVAMTDRVIEIRLVAPRPSLLATLAQPEMAIFRSRFGSGPFGVSSEPDNVLRLTHQIIVGDDEKPEKEEVLLSGSTAADAIGKFAGGKVDLVLGGTFEDLPFTQRVQLPRGSVRFDPASGLFGLVPLKPGGGLDDPDARRLLSQAIDRATFVTALNVPGLGPRATVLEPGLDGMPNPAVPAWLNTPIADRRTALLAEATRIFGKGDKPAIKIALPEGPGGELLLVALGRDWGIFGFKVERAKNLAEADFKVIDLVAPSASSAWFVRQFRCDVTPICDSDADGLMDAARQTLIPPQRYALLQQAALKIDEKLLFIPIAAPVRWSLVSDRIQGFAGNRYAIHTLTGLNQKPGAGD
jgi:peptide/nickel transport system substrate-binding protein